MRLGCKHIEANPREAVPTFKGLWEVPGKLQMWRAPKEIDLQCPSKQLGRDRETSLFASPKEPQLVEEAALLKSVL